MVESRAGGQAGVTIAYVERHDAGWTLRFGDDLRHFGTSSGAIFDGIQIGKELASAGQEVWLLWENQGSWSVAWTSVE